MSDVGFLLDIDTFLRRAEARRVEHDLSEGERIDEEPERNGIGGGFSPGAGR